MDKAASVRMSDWSRHQLTPEQIKYAAEDALVTARHSVGQMRQP